jgi:hypothetical protein
VSLPHTSKTISLVANKFLAVVVFNYKRRASLGMVRELRFLGYHVDPPSTWQFSMRRIFESGCVPEKRISVAGLRHPLPISRNSVTPSVPRSRGYAPGLPSCNLEERHCDPIELG